MIEHRRRRMGARAALCAALPVLWLALVVAGPAVAQTNSPSGNQPTGSQPASGGPSNNGGSNAGGGGEVGNKTTPGGAGATGGGSSGAGTTDTGGGGKAGAAIGVVVLLAIVGLGVMITLRHRRVMEEAGARPSPAR
jgi:uncharacterized membrane protein